MRSSIQTLLILAVFLTGCYSEKSSNVVFILVDDLGWADLGFMGNDFHETPNIDALSQESIVFNNAYASGSICSPSRAAIMTGRHPGSLNITDWIPGADPKDRPLVGPEDLDELPLEETTLPEIMRQNGYTTFFAGKWHLGGEGFLPTDQGFHHNIGGNHTGQPKGGYYAPYDNPQLPDGPDEEYLTDRLTHETMQFITDQSKNQQKFFAFLSFYTVHTPIQPSPHVERFREKIKSLSDTTPQTIQGIDFQTTVNHRNAEYASMVYSMDENVGKIIDHLKAEGLYENTTIVFTSDNGGLSTLLSRYNRVAPTSVLPLRGGKGWLYEGGIRVPLIIKPAGYHGPRKKVETPVIGHDLYPTLLSMANIQEKNSEAIEGKDLSPLWNKNTWDRTTLYWHYPHYHGSGWRPGAAIRDENWKLITFYETGDIELYNLDNDIAEQNDLSEKMPEKSDSLLSKLQAWQKLVNAKIPLENPDYKESHLH